MMLSELTKLCQETLEKHGDMQVDVVDTTWGQQYNIDSVTHLKQDNTFNIFIKAAVGD